MSNAGVVHPLSDPDIVDRLGADLRSAGFDAVGVPELLGLAAHRALGRGFAEIFLIPYSEKFWTVHPREMSFEWTLGRVPQPRLSQVLRGAPSGVGGLGDF